MVMNRPSALVFISIVLSQWPSLAHASSPVDEHLTEITIGAELFRWQEFDSAGNRLLTEQGPRARFKVSHHNEARLTGGFIYNGSVSLYGGNYLEDVKYDGQSQPGGHFSAADVDYSGGSFELLGGFRFKEQFWGRSLDLLAGAGLDSWRRDIGSGINSQGASVRGLVEDYKIVFTRFSIGMENRRTYWRSLWRVGVKYPIFTKETLDDPSVELEPGKELSTFFMYRFRFAENGNVNEGMYIDLVYDSYRFSKSPTVTSGNFLVHQPESSMDLIGLSASWVF